MTEQQNTTQGVSEGIATLKWNDNDGTAENKTGGQ